MQTVDERKEASVSVVGKTTSDKEHLAALPVRKPKRILPLLATVVGLWVIFAFVELLFSPGWGWPIVAEYLFDPAVLNGLFRTTVLTILSLAIGFVIGLVVCAARLSRYPFLRTIALVYIWLTRSLPILVVLLFIYFFAALVPTLELGIPGLPTPFSIETSSVVTQFGSALLGLSLYFGGKSAEIFRGGYISLDAGQHEAVRVLGLGRWTSFRKITGPQAFRVIIPSLANEVVTMFKNTSIVTVIGYPELLTTVQQVYAQTGETIPLLTVACIWYLAITSVLMVAQIKLEQHFSQGYVRGVRKP